MGRINGGVSKVIRNEPADRRAVRHGKCTSVDRRGDVLINVAVNDSPGANLAVEPANQLEGEPVGVLKDNRVDHPAQERCGIRVATGVARVRQIVSWAAGSSKKRCLEIIDDVANRVGNIGMVEEHFDSAHGQRRRRGWR